MKSPRRAIAQFDRENQESARIILADVPRYGGEGSGAVLWARAFLARIGEQTTIAGGSR